MSPENDQCRWIGIRPTNPPEDIPVTLDGEVAHVIVDSGGGAGIEPTTIATYPAYQAVTVANTWYTICNNANPGWIFYVALQAGTTVKNMYIGLTINGGARQSIQVNPRATYIVQNFRCNLADAFGVEFHGLRFKTSIHIEMMIQWVTTLRGTAVVGFD